MHSQMHIFTYGNIHIWRKYLNINISSLEEEPRPAHGVEELLGLPPSRLDLLLA